MKSKFLITAMIIGFAMVFWPAHSDSNAKLTLKKTTSLPLSKSQVNIVKEAKLDHIFTVSKGRLVPAKGVTFYATTVKGESIIFAVNQNSNQQDEDEITVSIYGFSIVGELGSTVLYCSCGSAVNDSLGDNCQHYATGEGTKCGGACDADNEGKSCSFTSFNIETGEIADVEGM